MTTKQKDIIKGVFYGQAIGDALGLGTEFLDKKQIAEFYPQGFSHYSQIVQDKHRSRWQIGAWTDDTDQFLCICDAILSTKNVDETAFAKELFKWFQGSPMGVGMTVLKVVTLPQFTLYPHKASHLVWKITNGKNAANGAIMRTSILGTWDFTNLENVQRNTENIAKVTHWDARCVGSCVIISVIIAELLSNNKLLTAQEIITIADAYDERIKPYVELAQNENIETLNLDEPQAIGYTLKAMASALWACFHAPDFATGILKVINEGGDADTNAAVAGSLLGAKFGFSSIPEMYVCDLANKAVLEDKFEKYVQLLQTENKKNG
ncbi:MAG: ADP-ribosylglycohydrolase family protein [Saprospiraceae bacterium]|jgi:ADP-ribosylglycohydrolase|nr:ADP-ribosylglycohydrolase family protein [Saprospiraceae bacterium]MCO5278180.1 ADP-ribosylglycohydrolase family protein [Saprospiraceae bacterium]